MAADRPPVFRAWQCICADQIVIVFAASRGQATATTVEAAREAGYEVAWKACRTTRAPELDAEAPHWPRFKPLTPSLIVRASCERPPQEVPGAR